MDRMSSLSLPRVLQPKKGNTLEQERENFEKFQAQSISKAVNQQETPLKEKHVRSAIIGTFQEKGAPTFWSCVMKLPLQGNPIVCWKFCHVLHKVLREGHAHVIPDSQKFRSHLVDLGKLWGHLKEGHGKLIQHYTRLLVTKLDFHRRNPRFPGNLHVTDEELENIGENDINNYFQMSVEMFDYMDEILALQSAVFGSLDMSRANSMTSTGQCRLAPLIPCIQDSTQLYDYCVKLLFKLHARLPPDTLSGHRDRFLKQFKILRQFYLNASTLQYFKYLLHVPILPETPPNFLIASDFSSHVTPVVNLHPESLSSDLDSVDMSLIDASADDSASTNTFEDLLGDTLDIGHRNGSVSPDVLAEKERYIEQLLNEIALLKSEIQRLRAESQKRMDQLQQQITDVEIRLAEKESELHQEQQTNEDLLQQVDGMRAEAADSCIDTERKAKAMEDKFLKMKEVYQKLREEHIQLLRQKADVEKQLALNKGVSDETESTRKMMETKLQEMMMQKSIAEETLQKAASEKEDILLTVQRSVNEKEEYIASLQRDVDEKREELATLKRSAEEREKQLSTVSQRRQELEEKQEELQEKLTSMLCEKSSLQDNLQLVTTEKDGLVSRLQAAEVEVTTTMNRLQQDFVSRLHQLLVGCIMQAEHIIQSSLEEFDNPAHAAITCTPEYFLALAEPVIRTLDSVNSGFSNVCTNPEAVDDLLQPLIMFAHLMGNYLVQGKATSHTSPDIQQGDCLAEACRRVGQATLVLLAAVRSEDKGSSVAEAVEMVKVRMKEVQQLTGCLIDNLKGASLEKIGDMFEHEISEMDKAIEAAAARIQELLATSREADTGVKLEVNEKILDSCTNLMKAVRVLIQKSKSLQAEIVLQGKGTASVTEFYKRNHRWTEGLLSAAKAVGLGAKFLVDAADQVVKGEAKFEQLVVASQEIAASTAQLVVSSKVKADRQSENLKHVSKASREVTEATGYVVATAKSCSKMVEDSDMMNFSKLTLHQAKKLEMESQVKVLELDSALTKERIRFANLRKQHYQLAGESEGWEQQDISQ